MNARTLTNYYTWGIKLLLFVIPFLSLWIARSMYFPYITGRNFGFRILIELALVLWLGLIVLNKEYRPRLTIITAALAIFLVILGLANLLGVNPYHSFWSSFERMEGYLMILHLTAYFLMLTSVFRTKKDWLVLFNLFLIAGILVGFYGILQKLGLKESIQGGEERIDGTIGNPTYLGAYLILIVVIAFVLLFNTRQRWLKGFYAATIVFNFIILYFTAARGVFLGTGIATLLFFILYLILFRKDEAEKLRRKLALAFLVLVIIIPFAFLLIKNRPWVRNNPVLSRFADISLNEKTVRSRFFIWNVSWRGFKERPLLGWGQENYIQVFSRHFDPRLYDQEPWFDRSHNIVFDWLINAGILGLAAYISLFVAFFVVLIRALRKNLITKKEGLILIVGPVAYFIQNLFVFDNFNTYILFFGLLAYVNSLEGFAESSVIPSRRITTNKNLYYASLTIVTVAAALMVLIIYSANIKPMMQARGIIKSLMATANPVNPVGETLNSFKKILNYNTFGNAETLEQLARVAKNLIDQGGIDAAAKVNFLQFAVPELEKYLERFPKDIRVRLFIGDLYQSASALDPAYLTKARDHFQEAWKLSPAKQQIIFVLANNYLANQEVDKALELLEKAIELEPSNPSAHTNKAVIAIIVERHDIVQGEINELRQIRLAAEAKNEPNALGIYAEQLEKIADVYIRFSNFQNARIIYEELVKLVPQSKPFAETLESLKSKQ